MLFFMDDQYAYYEIIVESAIVAMQAYLQYLYLTVY